MVVKTPLSSTDPIKEQEDGWSLDLENVLLQRVALDKSCSKSFRQLKYVIKMVVKTPLSSTDPNCSTIGSFISSQKCNLCLMTKFLTPNMIGFLVR